MRRGIAALVVILLSVVLFKSVIAPSETLVATGMTNDGISTHNLHIARASAMKSLSQDLIPLP